MKLKEWIKKEFYTKCYVAIIFSLMVYFGFIRCDILLMAIVWAVSSTILIIRLVYKRWKLNKVKV